MISTISDQCVVCYSRSDADFFKQQPEQSYFICKDRMIKKFQKNHLI